MGELDAWMDENYIRSVFSQATGDIVNVKIIRDKSTR